MHVVALLPAISGAVGGFVGEWMRQQSVGKRLDQEPARQWKSLGYWERHQTHRRLRRGRALEDASQALMGAQVAAALRARREWRVAMWLLGGLALVFLGIGIDALAHDRYGLAAVEIAVASVMAGLATWAPRSNARLAEAEQANRALVES